MDSKLGRISIIAALGKKTRAIGKDNRLLWSLHSDLRRFKELTTDHPVVMGRKTWESLPERFRPLPGRTNIVISRSEGFAARGATIARSFDGALSLAADAPGSEEIFVIGGGSIYAEALPRADRLYLTLVDDDGEGDAFFPEYKGVFTKELEREEYPGSSPAYTFLTLERS